MSASKIRQLSLKPQDLLVALKIAVNRDRQFTFSELGSELNMSVSEAHAATQRAELARLIRKEDAQMRAVGASLQEFVLHGVKYCYPPIVGTVARGMATSVGAPPLSLLFAGGDFIPVWPDSLGEHRGVSLQPIFPSVPAAAKLDTKLYEVLALIDAIRFGAARERELAEAEIVARL